MQIRDERPDNPLAGLLEKTLDSYGNLAQNIDRRADGLADAATTAMGSFDATHFHRRVPCTRDNFPACPVAAPRDSC